MFSSAAEDGTGPPSSPPTQSAARPPSPLGETLPPFESLEPPLLLDDADDEGCPEDEGCAESASLHAPRNTVRTATIPKHVFIIDASTRDRARGFGRSGRPSERPWHRDVRATPFACERWRTT